MNRRLANAGVTILLAVCAGAAGCRAPRPAPPAPAEAQEETSGLPDFHAELQVSNLCVVQNGQILQVNVIRGSTTLDGRPWTEVFPASAYAATAPWYVNNEPIVFNGHRYVKYGMGRSFGPGDLVAAGTYLRVTVFAEPNADVRRPEVVYVPVFELCEFQAYQMAEAGAAVRG
jgi:hypothetical protein